MSKIKNWKSFNENMNDNLLEVLITLEEIQKNLRRSRNPISIDSIDDKITFEYHQGAIYPENIGDNIKHTHYEKVEISEIGGEFIVKLDKVVDDTNDHYTPEEISFDNIDELVKFLNDRYINNNWSLEKKKKGRYLTNDGISDIPDSWR